MSDKPTANERLRQLLDKRGVEYSREGCETFFKNVHIWAINNKELCISISGLSPEQAVEATLGSGTCHWKYPQDVNGWVGYMVCSNCGAKYDECVTDEAHYCPNCGREVVS